MLSDTDTGTYLHIPAHTYIIHAHTCTYLYIPAHTLAGQGVTPGPERWPQQSLTQTLSQSGHLGPAAAAKSAGLDVA